MTTTNAPRPRTKKPTAVAPVDAPNAPGTTPIPQPTIAIHESAMPDLDSMSGDELDAFTAAMNAKSDAMESALAARETALRASLRDIEERRGNARQATALLNQQSTRQRQDMAQAEAQTARRTQQEAYEHDLEQRRRLFAEIQRLTIELAAAVKDALAVDSRIYSAALVLGISTQRGGFAKRATTDFIGRRLSQIGLSDMPYGRLDRNLVDDPQPSGGVQ